MARLPLVLPLPGISFETAVCALAPEPGFVAIDARRARAGGNRFSIVAASPAHRFASSGAFVTVDGHTAIDTPRTALEIFLTRLSDYACDPYLPFSGGAIGFIGFEGARALSGAEPAKGFSRFPQCCFGIYPTVAIFDHLEGTAFVVSNGKTEAAQAAEALRKRLQRASVVPLPSSRHGMLSQEIRFSPEGAAFERLVDEAFCWLRSDALSRIHLARHAVAPSQGLSAVAAFLAGAPEGNTQALFTHEGAQAIISSRGVLLEIRSRNIRSELAAFSGRQNEETALAEEERLGELRAFCQPNSLVQTRPQNEAVTNFTGRLGPGVDPLRALISLLPTAAFTGSPRQEAVSFLSEHEPTHRHFYGGAFGTIDARGLCFRTIRRSLCHADGAISVTAGCDLTPADDPREVPDAIAVRFADI